MEPTTAIRPVPKEPPVLVKRPEPEQAPPAPARPSWAGPRATGLAFLAIGVIAMIATFAVPGQDPWALDGSRFFPAVVSGGLILCSLAFLARVTIWPDVDLGLHAAREAADTDWFVPALVAGGLIGYVYLLEPLGYVIATWLFFPYGARVLGSRAPVRDGIAGLGLALGIYLLFTYMLGVRLPAGPLWF
jgi:putative tricarboxylic transport membrane protein